MTYYRICGLSLLLTAITLSGCSSLAKKGEVITPLDNSTVNTPSSTDTSDSSTSSYNIATLDPTPNTDYALGSSDAAAKPVRKNRWHKLLLQAKVNVLPKNTTY